MGLNLKAVVPYIGTWIETRKMVTSVDPTGVVPYIGTWIETSISAGKRYLYQSYLI